MGKILSGILGPVSGKIGGVVGARWKSSAYLRSYTIPGYSNTDAQAAQRTKFGYLVQASKPFVGRIFNPYYDKFLSRMSGFNRCISENMDSIDGNGEVINLMITDGPLYPGSGIAAGESPAGTWGITWGVELGVDGAATDVAIAWIRDPTTNAVAFSANGVRSDGTAGLTIVGGSGFTGLDAMQAGVFFAKMNDALVVKISRNLSYDAEAV